MDKVEIFVDTSAIYALLVARDHNHGAARAIAAHLAAERSPLVSSSFVLQESVALLQARSGVSAVRTFDQDIRPLLRVVWVDHDLYGRAMEALLAAGKRNVSIADWTSFVIMREEVIAHAFAFDPHFSDQGFHTLLPS